MANLKQQIITALGLEQKVSLEWQAKLTDGTIVVSPDVELTGGSEINILTEDGSQMPLPSGSYETEDGVGFTVSEDGVVGELLTEEAEAPAEEENVEMDEEDGTADIKDWEGLEKRIQQLEDAVADLKAEKEGGDDEVETEDGGEEEMSSEEPAPRTPRGPKTIKKTEVTEFSLADLKKQNDELAAEITKLKKAPAADALNLNKFSSNKGAAVELSKEEYSKLTAAEKFAYNMYK